MMTGIENIKRSCFFKAGPNPGMPREKPRSCILGEDNLDISTHGSNKELVDSTYTTIVGSDNLAFCVISQLVQTCQIVFIQSTVMEYISLPDGFYQAHACNP